MTVADANHQDTVTERDARPLRIVIVEDDDDARESLSGILELDGHQVHAARSTTEVLDKDWLSHADVLMLDRKLPDGMVEQLLPELQQRAPHADVIIVTGYADLQGTIEAMRLGATDYLLKPIDPAMLRANLVRLSKRRRTEALLREERQFAQKVLDTAEAMVVVLDTQGRVVRWNPYFSERTGVSLEACGGEDWFERFVPQEHRERVREVFYRTVMRLETRGVVNPILTANGGKIDVRWSNTTLRDADDNVVAVLAVGLDITDLLKAQQDVLQAERLAAIGRTMAGLAHESRNALQRIQNSAALLELHLQGDGEGLVDVRNIERAADDVRRLLEEVRSYAAPVQLDLQEIAAVQLWRDAWSDLEVERKDRDIQLAASCRDPRLTLRVDRMKMAQAFRNLFENSFDACADPVRLEIACESWDDRVRITYSDNGPGVPAEQSEQIFEAFHTTKPKGTGLGLSIVKRVIEAHRGEIHLERGESQPGARFVLELPKDPSDGI